MTPESRRPDADKAELLVQMSAGTVFFCGEVHLVVGVSVHRQGVPQHPGGNASSAECRIDEQIEDMAFCRASSHEADADEIARRFTVHKRRPPEEQGIQLVRPVVVQIAIDITKALVRITPVRLAVQRGRGAMVQLGDVGLSVFREGNDLEVVFPFDLEPLRRSDHCYLHVAWPNSRLDVLVGRIIPVRSVTDTRVSSQRTNPALPDPKSAVGRDRPAGIRRLSFGDEHGHEDAALPGTPLPQSSAKG